MSFKAIATLLYAQSERVRSAMTTPIRPLLSATSITSRAKASQVGTSESRGSHEHAAE
jgi:hypothetical protein